MPSALAVVAHHDDHVLWIGGTLQRLKAAGWDVTCVALCVPSPERQAYYCAYCKALGVSGHYATFIDDQGAALNDKLAMKASLLGLTAGKRYDLVFTHSRRPHREYGHHANHAEVEAVVTELAQLGELTPNPIAYFSYQAMYGLAGLATVAETDASVYLQLTYPELLAKCDWVKRAPDVESNLVGLAYPCPNPEAFDCDSPLPRPFVSR